MQANVIYARRLSNFYHQHLGSVLATLWVLVFTLQQFELLLLDRYIASKRFEVFLSANGDSAISFYFLIALLSPYAILAIIRVPVAVKAFNATLEYWLTRKSPSSFLFGSLVCASLAYPIALLLIFISKIASVLIFFRVAQ